ncbi:MAG: AbrB/MazE/SpoVT family DNA-binding domain-containing protein [Sphingomicrobium sp.]
MKQQYRAKTFKSGNSVALRLPKGLGIKDGLEMMVREEHGRYIVEPADAPKKKIDLTGIYGSCAGLKPLRPEDRVFEERELDWGGKLLKRD